MISKLEQYKNFRRLLIDTNLGIIKKYIDEKMFYKAAKVMGVVEYGEVVLEEQFEQDAIYDLAIHEKFQKGSTLIKKYVKEHAAQSDEEHTLLKSLAKAKASLFEVIAINKDEFTLVLKDIYKAMDTYTLLDKTMCNDVEVGSLIYTRLVSLGEYSISTGNGYGFNKDAKDIVILKAQRLMRKVSSGSRELDRRVAFFYVNRELS